MIATRILSRIVVAASFFTGQAFAQAGILATLPQTSQITFRFERPVAGVRVPHYTVEVHGDGSGLYHADLPIDNSPDPQKLDRPLTFTPATTKTVFNLIDTLQSSGSPCASKMKNIADTGTKTLTYRDPKGNGTCTYNYSENKPVAQLTELFQAVEFTLEEGRALDFKHRFDRLGLDAEMTALADAVQNGRAMEIGTIAATLRAIAGDTELIQRVRLRAAKLLEGVQAGE